MDEQEAAIHRLKRVDQLGPARGDGCRNFGVDGVRPAQHGAFERQECRPVAVCGSSRQLLG